MIMTSRGIEGHIRSLSCLIKYNLFLDILFFLNLCMHDNIILTQIFHDMKFDLKGHGRSHEVIFMVKRNFTLNIFFVLNLV